MEIQKEEVHPLKKISHEGIRVVEATKEKVVSLQEFEVPSWYEKFAFERNHLMEAEEKEKVPHYKSGIRAHLERSVAEKGSHMETKEEEMSPF